MTDASTDPARRGAPARFERPSAIAFLGYALGLVIIVWCL
jgi:phosphonate transport system permease protein